jgi:hypothetical protein
MNIFAVDPGPTESAWLIWRDRIISFGKLPNEDLLTMILERRSLAEVASNAPNDLLVIEQVASFGMPVGAEVFETVFWSGRFAEAWPGRFDRIKRHSVKMHLCGNMRAKDGNIRQALIDKFGAPGTKKNPGATYGISGDVWSALAVAVVYSELHSTTEFHD